MDLKSILVLLCLTQVFLSVLSQSPQAPAGLKLLKRDTSSISITWEGSSSNYEVEISPSAGTDGEVESTGTETWKYTQSELSPGTQYEFSVTAQEGNLTSLPTKESFYTVPNPPSKLTRTEPAKTTSLDIHWTKPAEGGCSIVQVSLDNGGTEEKTDLSHEFTGLRAGKQFMVTAACVVGGNVKSDQISEKFFTRPLPVKGIEVEATTNSSVSVKWSDSEQDQIYEKVKLSMKLLPMMQDVDLNKGTSNHTFKDLNAGTKYSFELRTVSGDQESEAVARNITTNPDAPSALMQSDQSEMSISVTWTTVKDQNKISGYEIRLLNGDVVISNATDTGIDRTATSHSFTNLEAGSQYEVDLRSFLVIEGSRLESSQRRALISTAPSPPTTLSITTNSHTEFSFSWIPPDHGVDDYQVVIKRNMELQTFDTDKTSLQVTSGLRAGAAYQVEVFSRKFGKLSRPLSLQVHLVPSAPGAATIQMVTTTSISVRWTAPQDSDVEKYLVEWKVGGSVAWESEEVATTEHTIRGLSEGQQIEVKVFSLNVDGDRSGSSSDVTGLTPKGEFTITPGPETTTSAAITWSEPKNSLVANYQITITPNPAGVQLPVTVSSNENKEYLFEKLTPGSEYTIQLKAISSGGGTAAEKSVTVFTLPEKVENLEAGNVSNREAELSWAPGAGTKEQYQVTYSSKASSQKMIKTTSLNTKIAMLVPGASYEFTVIAVSNGKLSEPATIKETTMPLPVLNLVATVKSPDTVNLTWEADKTGVQDEFQYNYKGGGGLFFGNWPSSSKSTVTISQLMPGQMYTFYVQSKSNEKLSEIKTTNATPYPLPPEDLSLVSKTTTSASFSWKKNSSPSVVTQWEFLYTLHGINPLVVARLNEAVTSWEVENLQPGGLYQVQVFSLSGKVTSQSAAETQVQLKPIINSILLEDPRTNTNSISLTYTATTEGIFDNYKFTLYKKSGTSTTNTTVERSKTDQTMVTFGDLQAGTVYFVEAMTVSGSEESSPLRSKDITTVPSHPEVGAEQQSTSLKLNIEQAEGSADYYIITYKGASGLGILSEPVNVTAAINSKITTNEYGGLRPNSMFPFSVVAWKNGKRSTQADVKFITQEDKPGQVNNLAVQSLTPNTVKVSWSKPLSPNGRITGYSITYRSSNNHNEPSSGFRNISHLVTATDTMSDTFDELLAGEQYTFKVSAWTKIGEGPKEEVAVTMLIWGPELIPDESTVPSVADEANDSQFDVSFTNPFSDRYGKVTGYTIIVSTNKSLVGEPNKLVTWAVASRKTPMGIFQIMEPCMLFDSGNDCRLRGARRTKRATQEEVTFTIGAEECDKSELSVFCNGPVKPSSQYFVKMRGFTENGNFTDTPYSKPIVTAKKPLGKLLLKVLIPVFLILIILASVFAAIIIKRRRKADRDTYLRDFHFTRKTKPVESSRPIAVSNFLDRVKELSADADFMYSEEFEDLKNVGRDQSTMAAELPVNRNKNRFTNILPYEHSRVKLLPTDDEEGSDYVNANYVPGYNSKREFIACQGPLPSTKDDFWRMVWEQNARAVVMLTRCVEKGREKCDHYWPVDSEPVFYGDLQVAILNETQTPEWDIREFTISKGQTSRRLTHFHYTSWPDFGVPVQPRSLVQFVQLVRERVEQQGGPIIVHCSAGVGRSGTYISLDTLLQQIKEGTETVDIFGVVYAMRLQRVCMVQTEQQYICIHNCLACVLGGEEETEEEEPGQDNEGFEVDEGIGES